MSFSHVPHFPLTQKVEGTSMRPVVQMHILVLTQQVAYQLGHHEEHIFETKRQLRKPEEVSRSPSIREKGKHYQSV